MKVIIPVGDLHIGGGCKVLVEIANALQDSGHETEIVIPITGTVKYPIRGKMTVVPSLDKEYIPEGDLILTNFYTTCTGAYEAYPNRCVRLSLGFEPFWVPNQDLALWTYKRGVPTISISHWLDDQIASFTNHRTEVISLGVDPNTFYPLREKPLSGARKVVLYIARNPAAGYEMKGFYDFQQAMTHVYESYQGKVIVHLICPEGELALPGIPHRVFHPKTETEMADLYRMADVFVSTSWFEAFALPPLEAMACGTPVVTTNSGGLLDYCTHMENCYVTQPKKPTELAEGILTVLNDETLAARFSEAGPRTTAKFTKEKYLKEFVNMLEDINRDRTSFIAPKVSVVIPFYNCPYIDQSIESILHQTYSNLELVVVDDGSTEYAEKLAPYRNRIKYVGKENGGTASALNAGIRNATGHYFTWLSADDVMVPDRIIKQVRLMQSKESSISFSSFVYLNEEGQVTSQPIRTSFSNERHFYEIMRKGCPINGCTVVMDMAVFETVGLFDESLPFTHDYDFWLRALHKFQFMYIDEPFIQYRVHSEMGTQKYDLVIQKELFVVKQKHKTAMDLLIAKGRLS